MFWNAEAETLPRERLEPLTLERMRASLTRVADNPAWRRRLGGVEPDDIKAVDDWRRLPFLTKDDLRDAYPFALACGRAAGYRRIQMSSGTTGNPILNPYTSGDVEQWGEVMARCYVAAGVGAVDVIQITPSFGLFTGVLGSITAPSGWAPRSFRSAQAGRGFSSRSCAISARPS